MSQANNKKPGKLTMMNDGNDHNPRENLKRQRLTSLEVEDLLSIGRAMWRRDPSRPRSTQTEAADFRQYFGCSVLNALIVWNMLVNLDLLPEYGQIHHFMWTLCFMKLYTKTRPMCALCGGIDPGTLKKWVWPFIAAIAALEEHVVSLCTCLMDSFSIRELANHLLIVTIVSSSYTQIVWENRLQGDKGNDCLVSVDGTDFKVPNFGPAFSSHKFAKKGGVRYEVALCILTGDIVWIHGPFPCGRFPDISIFRDSLMSHLDAGERVEADDGYIGEHPQHVKCPAGFANPAETKHMQSRVRSRQETINKRFKDWEILAVRYRHDLADHGDVVRAIAVISQITINQGERLFQCGYRDPPYGVEVVADDGNDGADDNLSL